MPIDPNHYDWNLCFLLLQSVAPFLISTLSYWLASLVAEMTRQRQNNRRTTYMTTYMTTTTLPKTGTSRVNSTKTTKNTNGMKLRFKVNQAECFRRGINCDKSITTVEVDPGTLPPAKRNLIADRLDGIDVVELCLNTKGETEQLRTHNGDYNWKPELIMANEPTFEALMEAVEANDKNIQIGRKLESDAAIAAELEGKRTGKN